MSISMQPSARYVTQSKLFSGNIIGRPLSDRRIAYYQSIGKYGPPSQPQKVVRRKQTKNILTAIFAYIRLKVYQNVDRSGRLPS